MVSEELICELHEQFAAMEAALTDEQRSELRACDPLDLSPQGQALHAYVREHMLSRASNLYATFTSMGLTDLDDMAALVLVIYRLCFC